MSEQYKVVYSPAALEDLDAIYSYIAFELMAQPTAKNQINRIRKGIRSLNVFPERYAKVGWEPWASAGMHRAPVDNFIVYYLVDSEATMVTIVRIFYGGRDVENIINSKMEAEAASLVNEALDEIDAGAQPSDGQSFFGSLKKKPD